MSSFRRRHKTYVATLQKDVWYKERVVTKIAVRTYGSVRLAALFNNKAMIASLLENFVELAWIQSMKGFTGYRPR